MINKTRTAVRTADRVRGHVGHADLTLISFAFDRLGCYRARYADNRDVVAGQPAIWSAFADDRGYVDVRRLPRTHSEVLAARAEVQRRHEAALEAEKATEAQDRLDDLASDVDWA